MSILFSQTSWKSCKCVLVHSPQYYIHVMKQTAWKRWVFSMVISQFVFLFAGSGARNYIGDNYHFVEATLCISPLCTNTQEMFPQIPTHIINQYLFSKYCAVLLITLLCFRIGIQYGTHSSHCMHYIIWLSNTLKKI